MSNEELILWGSINGWSKKLGISEDLLKERFKGLPTQECMAEDPTYPQFEIVTDAYSEPDVRRVLADLIPEWPIASDPQ